MITTYTLKQLEPVLHRKVKTIKDYINYGDLKATRINGRYLVTEEDLRNFLESYKVEY